MQAVTRNPLADPGVLGVNAGAPFAVVHRHLGVRRRHRCSVFVWFAFLGAAVASVVVYVLGSLGRGGATPVRLALAGRGAQRAVVRARSRGGPAARPGDARPVPLLGGRLARRAGRLVVTSVGRSSSSGWSLAARLGPAAERDRPRRRRGRRARRQGRPHPAVAASRSCCSCGAAAAAAGPIAFVGLVDAAHRARRRRARPALVCRTRCALGAGAAARRATSSGGSIARPGEVQVGIITAAIGGPVFIFLVRRAPDGAAVTAQSTGRARAVPVSRAPRTGARVAVVRRSCSLADASSLFGVWSIMVGDFPLPVGDVLRGAARRRRRRRRVHRRDAAPAAGADGDARRRRPRRVGGGLPVASPATRSARPTSSASTSGARRSAPCS